MTMLLIPAITLNIEIKRRHSPSHASWPELTPVVLTLFLHVESLWSFVLHLTLLM